VALEAVLDTLVNDLGALCGILHDLDVNAGDVGDAEGAHLADDVSESLTELCGLGQASLSSAMEARHAASQRFDPVQLRRSLAESQKQFQSMARNLFSNLLSYERISQLVQFGHERRPWRGWVKSVRHGLEKCRPAVETAEDAYFQCWQEIAERLGAGPVSLNTTNIGQQITTEALASRAAAHEGVT
jgi:hypothetical protein